MSGFFSSAFIILKLFGQFNRFHRFFPEQRRQCPSVGLPGGPRNFRSEAAESAAWNVKLHLRVAGTGTGEPPMIG